MTGEFYALMDASLVGILGMGKTGVMDRTNGSVLVHSTSTGIGNLFIMSDNEKEYHLEQQNIVLAALDKVLDKYVCEDGWPMLPPEINNIEILVELIIIELKGKINPKYVIDNLKILQGFGYIK